MFDTKAQFPMIKQVSQKYYVARNLTQEVKEVQQNENNIFQQVNLENNTNKGPRYTNKGDLLKHSIVGKIDWFNKIKNGKKTQFEESIIRQLPRSMLKIPDDQRSMPKSEIKSMTKITSNSKIKKDKRDLLTTKNQLLDEVDRIKQRIESNRITEKEKLQNLQPTLRRIVSKEERVQDLYQKTERQWNSFALKQGQLLNRDPGYCQLLQAENHRTKLEAAIAFEALKTDYELFGPRVWQMTLRKSEQQVFKKMQMKDSTFLVENPVQYDFIVVRLCIIQGSDLPNAFIESSVCGHKGSIEYVKKPNLHTHNQSETEFSVTSLPFKSFRSDKYLLQKISTQQDQFNQSLMQPIDKMQEFDQLAIIGQSVLKIETNMILNDGDDMTAVYRKQILKPEEYVEEIIAQDYSGQQRLILPPMKQLQKMRSVDKTLENSNTSQDFVTENDKTLN